MGKAHTENVLFSAESDISLIEPDEVLWHISLRERDEIVAVRELTPVIPAPPDVLSRSLCT